MKLAAVGAVLLLAACPSKKDAKRAEAAALAKMSELSVRMCECKDKACADHVQNAMTRWGEEMAKDPVVRDSKPDESVMKQMTELATTYGECMTKLLMGAESVHADPPAIEAIEARDADSLIHAARAWVTANEPGRLLSSARFAYVDANGVLDPEFGQARLVFGRSAVPLDDPKRKTGAPVPTPAIPNDCFTRTWSPKTGWQHAPDACVPAYDIGVRCTVLAIWKRAISLGDPADALATIALASTEEGRAWHFTIEDEPRGVHIAHAFVDDCPIAVER